MDVMIVLAILLAHTVSDFWLDANVMYSKENKSRYSFVRHSIVYSTGLMCLYIVKLPVSWIILNIILHTIVDFVTYRAAYPFMFNLSRYKESIIITCDQLIHVACLLLTYKLMVM